MKQLFLLVLFCTFAMHALAGEVSMPERQQTLSIIKPEAVADHHIGEIIARFEKAGLQIAAIKKVKLSEERARAFYAVHKERPFYQTLTEYMASGPIVVMVLEGDNAISKNRELMGATDPQKATSGTIRKDFGQSITKNAVHGSDSPETARQEIAFFFLEEEMTH